MTSRIQGIDDRQQFVLTRKGIQMHDQGFGRLVQLSRSVEELPAQRADVVPDVVRSQRFGQIGDRVVHQRHQPAEHLQGAAVEAWPRPVGALFIVATWHRIQTQIVDADAEALLLVLPGPEDETQR